MSCWSRAGRPVDTALFSLRHEQFLVPRLPRLISLPFPRIRLGRVPGLVQRALHRRPAECPKGLDFKYLAEASHLASTLLSSERPSLKAKLGGRFQTS